MKRMLIIEDDSFCRQLLKQVFNKEFEIDFSASAEEYYKKYLGKSYNIIIMDISLLGPKDGLTLTSELKKMPEYYHTPVLCLTAHAMSKDRDNAMSKGVDLFLTKPISNKSLREAVNELVTNFN